MGKYHLNGTFMGFEKLTTQLQLCSATMEDGIEFRRFGVTIINECNFDLTLLVGNN
jgi:hypothetical protein